MGKREEVDWDYQFAMSRFHLATGSVLNLKGVTVTIHSSDKVDGILPAVSDLLLSTLPLVGQQHLITNLHWCSSDSSVV